MIIEKLPSNWLQKEISVEVNFLHIELFYRYNVSFNFLIWNKLLYEIDILFPLRPIIYKLSPIYLVLSNNFANYLYYNRKWKVKKWINIKQKLNYSRESEKIINVFNYSKRSIEWPFIFLPGLPNSNFRNQEFFVENQEFIRGIFSVNQEKNQEFFLSSSMVI
jgi:hypothetical protein